MQINLQVLDYSYLICSMILEIPNYAQHQFTMNKMLISRSFKRLIEFYDQRAFHLAAENYRDNLVLAARALNKSNWQEAVSHIANIGVLMRHTDSEQSHFLENLTSAFKEASLKAFLFRAARMYESFSILTLAEMFGMTEGQVTKFASKMIMSNQL
jgi:hypothetical protein